MDSSADGIATKIEITIARKARNDVVGDAVG